MKLFRINDNSTEISQEYMKNNSMSLLISSFLDVIVKLISYYFILLGLILISIAFVFSFKNNAFNNDPSRTNNFLRLTSIVLTLATVVVIICLISLLILFFYYLEL